MRVLVTASPLSGHVLPLIPLASGLRDAGHDVRVATGPGVEGPLASADLVWEAVGPDFGSLVGEALTRDPDTPLGTTDDQQRFGFGRLFSEVRVDVLADATRRVAAAYEPDLVVNEPAEFVGPLVAAERGIPNATVGIGLVLAERWQALAADGVARAWRAAGLAPRPDAGLYRCCFLDQWPRPLQRPEVAGVTPRHELRPVAVGTGLPVPADLDHLGRDRPLVYVTFGTVFGDASVVSGIAAALVAADLDVLVTTGEGVDPDAVVVGDAGGRVEVRAFVPQGAVLGRCAAMVTHGGAGSVIGALAHGVPLVVLPMGADQAENAARVAACGVGVDLGSDARPDATRDAVLRVLGSVAFTRAAREIRERIAAMPAVADVVPVLERLVADGAPRDP